jgi:2-succinyl-5-enolpyruvyl-6-hydroxy-3-cyclohexene-1-carboxylate synthase
MQNCHILIQELVANDVDYFCFAPGSRTTPLIYALSLHPQVEIFIHFDERALGFHALGYSKALKKPAAIIVTSGTACGNLLPAIMEAFESKTPLIILTADRPYELQDCGANQTTHQNGMFKNFICYESNFVGYESSRSEASIRSFTSRFVQQTLEKKLPVHINCMFKEPFETSAAPKFSNYTLFPKIRRYYSKKTLQQKEIDTLAAILNNKSYGILLVGQGGITQENFSLIDVLSKKLCWPIFLDILNERPNRFENEIFSYNLLTKFIPSSDGEEPIDCIVQIGDAMVSKSLLEFIKNSKPQVFIHLSESGKIVDSDHLVTDFAEVDTKELLSDLLPKIDQKSSFYVSKWKELDLTLKNLKEEFFTCSHALSELHFFNRFKDFNFSFFTFFVGNSTVIRNALDFFEPNHFPSIIYGNRGLSGIDGNISTALSIAKASKKPMVIFLGDLTSFHDLTSFYKADELKTPITLIILNNFGGNIFSTLPVSKNPSFCSSNFIIPHSHCFEGVKSLFNIDYDSFENLDLFFKQFSLSFKKQGLKILELKIDKEINNQVLKDFNNCLSNALLSANWGS